jgi:hypothetical protein
MPLVNVNVVAFSVMVTAVLVSGLAMTGGVSAACSSGITKAAAKKAEMKK